MSRKSILLLATACSLGAAFFLFLSFDLISLVAVALAFLAGYLFFFRLPSPADTLSEIPNPESSPTKI
ncbi:MAG TPA: hypothetical protein VJS64_03745, partial [Pyrinomonadaceae bacterium]|nr:hypothetical protein [Pyrinomonadaceae bacterium]